MPSETASNPATDALALLSLPAFNSRTEQQARGITCVWDGIALTGATAIDLGRRPLKRLDCETAWFPRGCRPCVLQQAMQALHLHCQSCEQCVDDSSQCPTGTGLVRLIREARR